MSNNVAAADSGEDGIGVNDGFVAAGANQLVADIVGDLRIRQAGEGIMDDNTLAQGEGLAHARPRSKDADTPGVFEIIQAVEHFQQVLGEEPVLFLDLLFVKGIKGQSVIAQRGHYWEPPVLE